MKHAIIAIDQISKTFLINNQPTEVLHKQTATFMQSATYGLTGPSGAGKSTLLYILAGLAEPSSGTATITYDTMSPPHIISEGARHNIGLVFQKTYVITELSVIENVMLPGLIAKKLYTECYDHAIKLLQYVGLERHKDAPIGALSGGEQQRVQIARALFNRPLFLIADEPTSNLDDAHSAQIIQLLLDCHRDWNMGLIISTHNTALAQQMNYHYHLKNGVLFTS